jgi:quercetin 2,3-dioxygenase
MTLTLRRAGERGHADHGWLDTFHTFSFADYYDPAHMGFRFLRVINEDRVAPGKGFGRHPHRDMEIVTYVLDGALQHEDSMGTGSVIRRGEVQRMSAGTGVFHSEFNASQKEAVHFLQIWIVPDRRGHAPSYEQKAFSDDEKSGRLRLIASRDGRDGSLSLNQDAEIYAALLAEGQTTSFSARPGRGLWVHVARGAALVMGHALAAGDALAIEDATTVAIEGGAGGGEILLFDLGGEG